jgi:protein involved in polysaccharide export with SLBB domain
MVLGWTGARAQVDPQTQDLSRQELQALLNRLELAGRSSGYSDVLRQEAMEEAASVRARLAQGDFRPGDRILLGVDRQASLSDTFTVQAGQVIDLPGVGEVSLAGVMRGELESRLQQFLVQYVRDPNVRAWPLLRIGVVGAVARPGFYYISADAVVADVVMAAGGPTPQGNLQKVQAERGEQSLLTTGELREAMAAGNTLGELGLRSGDRFVVPQLGGLATAEGALRITTLLLSLALTAVAIF